MKLSLWKPTARKKQYPFPAVTINKAGKIYFNVRCGEYISGKTKSFRIFYDSDKRILAFEPMSKITSETITAYKRDGRWLMTILAFFRDMKLDMHKLLGVYKIGRSGTFLIINLREKI